MNIKLFGIMLLVFSILPFDGKLAKPEDQKVSAEQTKKAEEFIRKGFPVLANPGMPPLVPMADEVLSRVFPQQQFFILRFRLHPVAQVPPEPLASRNLFAVTKDGKVQHLKDAKALEQFFTTAHSPVTDDKSAKDDAEAWLLLVQEFTQDGFFKFSIPKDSLSAEKVNKGWGASGKVIVAAGGKGEIRADLTFSEAGRLIKVEEKSTVKAGIRPICQATKLLDPDPVVRQMAEKDILVMGQAAKEYLDEQRVKASPELRQAIDRIWQRILKEGW